MFRLKEKTVKPCLGCDVCKKKEVPACVQKDDMGALVERIDQCDGLVIAAPIYFGGICGQAKTFIDRLYCFYNPTKPGASVATKRGKKAALVCTCGGGPVDVYTTHAQGLVGSLGIMGADETKALVLGGIFPAGSVKDNADYQQQLSDLVNQTLENSDNKGIQVYIGQETPIQSMKDCSVVTATYELGEGLQGTIGIIGPKRMDYENVLKTLKTLTEQLDEIYNRNKK